MQSNPPQPMAVAPGEAHRDCLLLGRAQASLALVFDDEVTTLYHNNDNTLVYSSHSFHPFSQTILGAQQVSDPPKTPCLPRNAPWLATAISETTPSLFHHNNRKPHSFDKTSYARYTTTRSSIRDLTHTFNDGSNKMTSITTVPGSPPDLTDSRSSKSSSFGSHASTVDELATEITHFEEIGLDDDDDDDRHTGRVQRSSKRSPAAEEVNQAPYYTARRPTLSDLQRTKSRSDFPGPKTASSDLSKRGFTSPAETAFSESRDRHRSSSPPKRLTRSASALSFGGPPVVASSPRSSFAPPSRRGSWQPRKTIAEIEAEYDDLDDELPDDASLYNVPISPFPTGNRSALSSARGSPERTAISNPQPLPLEHVRSEPDSVAVLHRATSTQALSRHRLPKRTSSSNLSKSHPASPQMPVHLTRNNRAKTWNAAMSELNEEARIITQNLERHMDESIHSKPGQSSKGMPPFPHRSSAPGIIQLPPIQRGALDFMPISKEKEAILSRTRPSWLPPKDPKEEKRHLKEYQKMMAASIEAEKKREVLMTNTQYNVDDSKARLNRIWHYYVEPSTDIANIDRRVNDLCWRGIPPRYRGKVWQRTIGNSLGLTPRIYQAALDRAQSIKAKGRQELNRSDRNLLNAFADIERDAETAFPELNLFQRKGPLWQELINVCEAHACYRSDVGYFYGIQLISAFMLLQVQDASEAFILLENCLNSPVPLAFQTGNTPSTQRAYNKVISMLGVKFPGLHDYLFGAPEQGGLGMTGEEVLETMFRTMFSNGLDVDRLCRVWDIWVFEGDRTLVRTAVALLGSLEQQIYSIQGDLHLKRRNVQEMLGWGPFNRTAEGGHWNFKSYGSEEKLVEAIRLAGQLDYTGQ